MLLQRLRALTASKPGIGMEKCGMGSPSDYDIWRSVHIKKGHIVMRWGRGKLKDL